MSEIIIYDIDIIEDSAVAVLCVVAAVMVSVEQVIGLAKVRRVEYCTQNMKASTLQ